MKTIFHASVWASVWVLMCECPAAAQATNPIADEVKAYCVHLPFVMPVIPVPAFPARSVNIVDFKAVADGHTMNTRAFADAIAACMKEGGGTVEVPPGTWLTGPIKLESNVNLHLESGALVQFSNRIEDFPLIAGFDGKSKKYIITPPIHAYRAKNVAITGEGIVDGAGEAWRYVKKEKQTERQWKDLVASGGVVSADGKEWWPSREAMEGEDYLKGLEKSGKALTADDYAKTREFLRPDLVQLVQCDGILLDGPTFQNSPKFHVRPIQSENIIIRDVKVFAPWYGQNNDGIDPASCRNMIIYKSTVDVGDDGLCLKPGSIAKSQKPGPSCENILIVDCVVYHAHGGFTIGSESFGGVNNVAVRNCVFVGTDVGVRFKSMRGNGGLVENVFIDGIQMKDIQNEAILFDMYYGGGAPEVESSKDRGARQAEQVNDRTPRFQNISMKNIVCNGAARAMVIEGLPEMPVRNIVLDNVSVSAKNGVSLIDVDGVQLNGCRFDVRTSPLVSVSRGQNVTLKGGEYPTATGVLLKVSGEKSGNIHLINVDAEKGKNAIEIGGGARADAVSKD